MTGRRLEPLTLDRVADIPSPCRSCVCWELSPVAADRARRAGDTAFEKEAWISAALLEWGSVGRLAYLDDVPVGYLLYAPAHLAPRSHAFPTSPISPDAVLLATGMVLPAHRGGGVGRMLVQSVAKDLTRRGVRAIEAFGVEATPAFGTGLPESAPCSIACMLPADFLRSVGFATVRPHPKVPRLRLDLRTTLSWREDVEQALERLLGSVRSPVPSGT